MHQYSQLFLMLDYFSNIFLSRVHFYTMGWRQTIVCCAGREDALSFGIYCPVWLEFVSETFWVRRNSPCGLFLLISSCSWRWGPHWGRQVSTILNSVRWLNPWLPTLEMWDGQQFIHLVRGTPHTMWGLKGWFSEAEWTNGVVKVGFVVTSGLGAS